MQMNQLSFRYRWPLGVAAVLLMAMAAAPILSAQTTTLQGQIVARPMSRDDIAAYSLAATTELSGGLTTVGIGQPLYLEVQIPIGIAASDVTGVTWQLTAPASSKVSLTDSPLGKDVPIWEPSDRSILQVAGRTLLRPDVEGQYKVTANVATATNGTATATFTATAGTYKGIAACSLCHKGAIAPDTVTPWSQTAHASIFKNGIDGVNGATYGSSCWGCHTVGYDPAATAANGGFDKVMAANKWTPPAVLKAGNFDAMPADLKNVANIQCENCHGPGSQHIANAGSKSMISVEMGSGVCGQCHGAATHHVKTAEWNNSMHAMTTRDPSGAGREGCVGCHTTNGFIGRMNGAQTVNTDFGAINCQTCHEPHGQTTPTTNTHLVRTLAKVTLQDGTEITGAGSGMLCMNCHQSRRNAATYAATTAASSTFGPHHSPQADMLKGTNGFTYGINIPSSAHGDVVADTCVTCHMQAVDPTTSTFTNAGGHTFRASWAAGGVDLVTACQGCHGPDVAAFDFPLFDYNNDGVIEGVQTEVQKLLDQLSALLPPVGQPKTALTIDSTWTRAQLEAGYNWQFVNNDGSKGVHNTAYAVGLLKASIANLKGGK